MMIAFSVTNIATSRTIVRELEKRLEGASKEELSELARTELENVVSQIKAQQDIMGRQNQLAEILQQHAEANEVRDKAITEQAIEVSKQNQQILTQGQALREQSRVLTYQVQKTGEHDKIFEAINAIDKQQDKDIQAIVEVNEKQDKDIQSIIAINNEQEKTIQSQSKRIGELELEIEALNEKLKTKGNKILLIATSVASVGALILSILHFFI